jgi:hypothetical protein
MNSSSSIRIIVYGGSTVRHRGADSFDGFMQHHLGQHASSRPRRTGVPILYKFRHLRDNTLAMISLTSRSTPSCAR